MLSKDDSAIGDRENQRVGLYVNGILRQDTLFIVYSTDGEVHSTGGREITLQVNSGDEINLRSLDTSGQYAYINFCAVYVPQI